MADVASSVLTPWSNFYFMTGSSAATLTGLMFVVITLVSRQQRSNAQDGISTFTTPTVVHFCAALFVSAVVIAPWRSLLSPAALLGLAGLYGVVHVLSVMLRARRLSAYRPDLEDWISHAILPMVAYGAIAAGAIALPTAPVQGLFAVAAGVVFLIFIGIHNAWDVVTYIVTEGLDKPTESSSPQDADAPG